VPSLRWGRVLMMLATAGPRGRCLVGGAGVDAVAVVTVRSPGSTHCGDSSSVAAAIGLRRRRC
jgi:hypothetical protein